MTPCFPKPITTKIFRFPQDPYGVKATETIRAFVVGDMDIAEFMVYFSESDEIICYLQVFLTKYHPQKSALLHARPIVLSTVREYFENLQQKLPPIGINGLTKFHEVLSDFYYWVDPTVERTELYSKNVTPVGSPAGLYRRKFSGRGFCLRTPPAELPRYNDKNSTHKSSQS